jgi:hypothetical protein
MTSQIALQVTRDRYNGFMGHSRENDTMYVLLEDDLGRLALRRLRLWDRIMARCRAARLDRELARGARPETNAGLAARALRLTSMKCRRELAASLQRILAAVLPVGSRGGLMAADPSARVVRQPHVPIRRDRISRSASELAELAARLVQPGPVPARGVAMVCQLLTDGGGPLYRKACRDDLAAIAEQATQALIS